MEPRDLVKVWDAPDNSKLTSKQWSIRLPIHVAARISALCELYPRKTKTEIIGDLLATALDQLEEAIPLEQCDYIGLDHMTGEEVRDLRSPRAEFYKLTNKYLAEFEDD